MSVRRVSYDEYMELQMQREVQDENERLRERCHKLVFELEHERAIRWSLQERVVFQGAVLEEIQEIVAGLA